MSLQVQKTHTKNLSHYEILKPLGRGSNSFVYKAKHIFTNNIVALKVIDITTGDRLNRAKKEVQIHKALSHKGVVGYVDDFKDDSYWYLVLEYCEKGELYSYLKRRNFTLAESEIREIGLQLLCALEYLEDCRIMHLDIKLGNILIKSDMEVKLCDFGFSEKIGDSVKGGSEYKNLEKYSKEVLKLANVKPNCGLRSKSQTPLCKNNKQAIIKGTPNYIAPELLVNGIKSHKSDIWSLGCVLYALAVGKTPFEGKNIDHTFDNILNNSLNFPSQFSNNFKELLKSMLESKPKKRKSAKELIKMPFFSNKDCEDNTLSTIATDLDITHHKDDSKKEVKDHRSNYLNQIDKKTIHDIMKKNHIARNKSLNTEPSDKNLFLAKSIKSKRLINEILAKQSSLAATIQNKYAIGKLDTIGKISIQRNFC